MKKKLILNFVYLFLVTFLVNVNAQEILRSTRGTIQIKGVWNDSPIVAVSNELIIILNYETAQFELRLDKASLRTGIDSLDTVLRKLNENVFIYEGKLDIEMVRTQDHPPQDFIVEGYLTCAEHNEQIIGKGHLEHIFDGVYSCFLNMTFNLSLNNNDIVVNLLGLKDDIQINIIQAVLKRENE